MERQQTAINRPPLLPTSLSPLDIIGPGNMRMFVEFILICKSGTNSGEFPGKRLDREIGAANRTRIAFTLAELRANGYYPDYVNSKGNIVWKVVVKSKNLELFEKGLPELQAKSIAELQQIGRSGYLHVVKSVEIKPLDGWETGFERAVARGAK